MKKHVINSSHYICHDTQLDRRFKNTIDLSSHYNALTISPEIVKRKGPELITPLLKHTQYAFAHGFFYCRKDYQSGFDATCNTLSLTESHFRNFIECAYLLAYQNLPIDLLIDEPFRICNYSMLITNPVGRCYLSILLKTRVFSLTSITGKQLEYSLIAMRTFKISDPEISLFYVMAVTAGERTLRHLYKLLKEHPIIISYDELYMQPVIAHFGDELAHVPVFALMRSAAGRAVLSQIFMNNHDLLRRSANLKAKELELYQRVYEGLNDEQRLFHKELYLTTVSNMQAQDQKTSITAHKTSSSALFGSNTPRPASSEGTNAVSGAAMSSQNHCVP